MITFDDHDDSVPIALQKYNSNNAQNKNRIVYYTTSQQKEDLSQDDITDDMLTSVFGSHAIRSMKSKQRKRDELVEMYNGKDEAKKFSSVSITDNSKFRVIPYALGSDDESFNRFVMFLNGKSGSGKSWFSKDIMEICRAYGITKIYVITDVKDPKFGKVKYLDINSIIGENTDHEKSKKEYE